MAKERRLVIETQGRQDCYPLPKDVGGEVVGVQYATRQYETIFSLFEAPVQRSWLRVYALDKRPTTPEEVRRLLERAHKRITYRPVWMCMDGSLYVFPAPVNSGEYLILTIDETPNER